MAKFKVVIGFTVSKLYEVDADDEEKAVDIAYERAHEEENTLLFDEVQCVDVMTG